MKRLFIILLFGVFGAASLTVAAQSKPTCGCSMLPVINQIAVTVAPPFSPPRPIDGSVTLKAHRVRVIIEDQVATTSIEQEFLNEGSRVAEGEYLFPLPPEAAITNLTLYINGEPVKAQLLDVNQARAIYNETVRKLRDPALLQYVGRQAVQAKIFPIAPGETRKVQLTYSHLLKAENGLLGYLYPLKSDYVTKIPARQVSVSVSISSKDPIGNVYSPDTRVAVSRKDDRHVDVGFESATGAPTEDFSLYYSLSNGGIGATLLTYRDSANEDGYFMLMLTPPFQVDNVRVAPKDVILVLDQSGSMQGKKWDQARAAARFVLARLNPEDRFNVIAFSTGYKLYAMKPQPVVQAADAANWVTRLDAEGGTNIDAALTQAALQIDPARLTSVLFMTDGQPTEGETRIEQILAGVRARAKSNLRLFAFGVGDDVNTFLLDTLSSENRGQSVYVRPAEDIEAKVSALYNKITAPVLTDLKLELGDFTVDDLYPGAPLPDLFAGNQLIITGRYRRGGTATAKLTGKQSDSVQTFTYDGLEFRENAGGQPFVARLWATRRIGALLNTIRLKGETTELVDSVKKLSIRFGILTPYTAFLAQEPGSQPVANAPAGTQVAGVPRAAGGPSNSPAPTYTANLSAQSGAGAVNQASDANQKAQAAAPEASANAQLRSIGSRTFALKGTEWIDTTFDAAKQKITKVTFLSDEYFKLLEQYPELREVAALGERWTVVIGDVAYQIAP